MIRVMILIPAAAILLACGLIARIDDSAKPQVTGDIVVGPPPGGGSTASSGGDIALPLYAGDSLIEEKVINSSTVVRATMASSSLEVIVDADGEYAVAVKFNLVVTEYLKGTGPSNIVAVWVDGNFYDSREKADSRRDVLLAERDTQWDDREAIIFLYGILSGFGASLDAQLQRADHFLLYVGDPYSLDDFYSLHSTRNKRWLPAATSTVSTDDDQEFLLDVPPPVETITLGDLKRRITEVTAEFDGGDGSEEYRHCVLSKYRHIRNQRNWPEERGNPYGIWDLNYSLISGQPVGTVLDERESGSNIPNVRITRWLEGSDSSLFDYQEGDSTAADVDRDGENDDIRYDIMVSLARPIPAGEYRFDLKEAWPRYAICNFVISNEWTVTAVAPEGVLHEALFDPVTDGSAVAADNSNGVLKPASFTDAGATSTIERIEWEAGTGESGTVKLKLSPHNALAGRVVDFIELDSTVSLSLIVDDATVDAANHTLTWTVASQPWEDGDQLMVRIRDVP